MMQRRVAQARVGRLATIGADGQPHIVPVCFAATAAQIVTAVDHKPKTTTALKRLDNVRANPAATLLVDHFEEDWSLLWWVRVDGLARVIEPSAELDALLVPLHEKYRGHYGLQSPRGPAIVMDAQHFVGWAASTSA